MKTIKEMSFDQRLTWACGTVIMGIGEGTFRSAMSTVLVAIAQEAFERGRESSLRDEKLMVPVGKKVKKTFRKKASKKKSQRIICPDCKKTVSTTWWAPGYPGIRKHKNEKGQYACRGYVKEDRVRYVSE